MKAFVIYGGMQTGFEEREMPKLRRPDDVLVKIKNVGICGSDVHTFDGSRAFRYPVIPGHEISGEVVAVGEQVTALKPGTPVVHRIELPCGSCYACRHGKINCCANLNVTGATMDGGFREYMTAPESQWIAFDRNLFSYRQAAMVEPFTIGAQAAERAQLCRGDRVLIHGAGPIGLVVLAVAKSRGAVCVVSEMIPERLSAARRMGADHVINPGKENLEEKIRECFPEEGPNVVFDAVGLSGVFSEAAGYVSNAGRLVTLGFSEKAVSIPMNLITSKELSVIGSRNEAFQTEKVIADFQQFLPAVDAMISSVFPFAEARKAFDLVYQRDPSVIKVLVEM